MIYNVHFHIPRKQGEEHTHVELTNDCVDSLQTQTLHIKKERKETVQSIKFQFKTIQ